MYFGRKYVDLLCFPELDQKIGTLHSHICLLNKGPLSLDHPCRFTNTFYQQTLDCVTSVNAVLGPGMVGRGVLWHDAVTHALTRECKFT